jgi:DNA processing protein
MNTVLIHLNLIKGVGPATIEKLVASSSFEAMHELYRYSVDDFVHLYGLPLAQAHSICDGLRDRGLLEQELEYAQREGITIISIDDALYPSLLRNIYLPPPVLYMHGSLNTYRSAIALIGSRTADLYAKKFIEHAVPELIKHDIAIISGGAYGADTMAHEATVASGGVTIAVLGSGLLRLYPLANKQLFARIRDTNGVLVSPFSLYTEPKAYHFPIRNRIIAGLSSLCVVVQAAEKSGALITARFALEQGKEIGAVPGDVTHPLSKGCHRLLQEGAHVITSAYDICAVLGITHTAETEVQKNEHRAVQNAEVTIVEEIMKEDDLSVYIRKLCVQKPLSVDEMVMVTGSSLLEVQNALFDLHIQGLIKETIAGYWQSH